jgi:hypothetical protein
MVKACLGTLRSTLPTKQPDCCRCHPHLANQTSHTHIRMQHSSGRHEPLGHGTLMQCHSAAAPTQPPGSQLPISSAAQLLVASCRTMCCYCSGASWAPGCHGQRTQPHPELAARACFTQRLQHTSGAPGVESRMTAGTCCTMPLASLQTAPARCPATHNSQPAASGRGALSHSLHPATAAQQRLAVIITTTNQRQRPLHALPVAGLKVWPHHMLSGREVRVGAHAKVACASVAAKAFASSTPPP